MSHALEVGVSGGEIAHISRRCPAGRLGLQLGLGLESWPVRVTVRVGEVQGGLVLYGSRGGHASDLEVGVKNEGS